MTISGENQSPEFGGPWTREKLDILESYLDAYTTALKGNLSISCTLMLSRAQA